MVKFIADSSCNLDQYEGVDFIAVPMTIYTNEKSYLDAPGRDTNNMLDYLAKYKGRSYTSCPNVDGWLKAYEGGDEIYVVTITSALSGTYNAAMAAKQIFIQDHPDAKIEVFDSRSTGPEMHLILEKLVELHKAGYDFDEICKQTRQYMQGTRLLFSLASLHNLAENGRVNKVLASTIGMLGINIIATASEEGEIKPIGKCRGEKNIISTVIKEMEKAAYVGGKVRICQIECEAYAHRIAQAIRDKFANADVQIYPAGSLCSFYAERGGLLIGLES